MKQINVYLFSKRIQHLLNQVVDVFSSEEIKAAQESNNSVEELLTMFYKLEELQDSVGDLKKEINKTHSKVRRFAAEAMQEENYEPDEKLEMVIGGVEVTFQHFMKVYAYVTKANREKAGLASDFHKINEERLSSLVEQKLKDGEEVPEWVSTSLEPQVKFRRKNKSDAIKEQVRREMSKRKVTTKNF